MNDGAGGDSFSEIDSAEVADKPYYTEHTTSTPNIVGATYLFYLKAININGECTSESVAFILADKPATPTAAPYRDFEVSSASQLKISYAAITDNGGSPILSYSLEIDDGQGGPFQPLYGVVGDTMVLSTVYKNVTRGQLYQTRYRARNAIGWSEYSPIGHLLAA